MKSAIIDVGGGLRGIFTAGVYDRMLDDNASVDLAIGVSAGAGNLCSFLAGQKDRNYKFYTEYAFSSKYMSLARFLFTGSYVDLDYIYSTLSNSTAEWPLDFQALKNNPTELIVVATDAYSGKAKYFTKDDMGQDNYDILKASSAVPRVNKPYVINKIPYYDGALADPVPIKLAIEKGAEKVILLLTRPANVRRKVGKDSTLANGIRRRYYNAAIELENRADKYNDSVDIAKDYEREGRALIISPDDISGLRTFTKDKEALLALYKEGYEKGGQVKEFLEE